MIIMTDPRVPTGELDEYHLFRLKKFKHLYLCPSCKSSFDSEKPVEKCMTCSSDLIELSPEQKTGETRYRYYCTSCEKTFTVTEKAENCINCGGKFIHLYEWSGKEVRDGLRIRAIDFRSFIEKMFSRLLRTRPAKATSKKQKIINGKNITDAIEDVIIEQSTLVRPVFRLNLFSRNIEEMPTR